MGPRQENFRQNEKAVKVFEGTKMLARNVLKHPFIPQEVRIKLLPVLERTKMLSDEEFNKTAMEGLVTSFFSKEETMQQIEREIGSANGMCIGTGTKGRDRKIVMRKRYFETEGANRFGIDLFAEELGHAFSIDRKVVPFSEINDADYALLPFYKKEELLGFLTDIKRRYNKGNFVPEKDIIAISEGFQTRFSEKNGINYPVILAQKIMEETRASILQTIFEITAYGVYFHENEVPANQFLKGIDLLLRNINTMPAMFQREIGALSYIGPYLDDATDIKTGIQNIFSDFGTKTLDEYLKGADEISKNDFVLAVRGSWGEFRLR